ncbi:hypothetical protein [Rhizobium ruizarguesonis]|uniref:hypothetical protein n=1 Tax=Rhizobium ruizarguesonis TaxID=2081791 RepID=UPI0013EF1CA7
MLARQADGQTRLQEHALFVMPRLIWHQPQFFRQRDFLLTSSDGHRADEERRPASGKELF